MRIVSGTHKGRKIHPPRNLPVRPTTDLAKESLFNILNNNFYFEDIKVLDLFAGTGNMSFEFASRGVPAIISVDINFSCVKFINETANSIDLKAIRAIKANAFRYIDKTSEKFDIINADPPYNMENIDQIPDLIFERQILNPEGWMILEHDQHHSFHEHQHFYQLRKYGKVHFSIFR